MRLGLAISLFVEVASAQEPIQAPAEGASLTVFGTLDLGLRAVDTAAGVRRSVSSGGNTASKFGLRGVEPLGGGLRASFWLESSVEADSGSSGSPVAPRAFWDRRATVSVSGPYGEWRLGRDYTPIFRASAPSDPFIYVGLGSVGNLFSPGSIGPVREAFGSALRPNTLARTGNALHYFASPGQFGWRAHGMVSAGEGDNAEGSFRMLAASATYLATNWQGNIYGGRTRIDATGQNFDLLGLNAVASLTPAVRLSLGAADTRYQRSKQFNVLVGAWLYVGGGTVRASLHRVEVSGTSAAGARIEPNDSTQFALGYVHPLSRRTALYATAVRISNRGGATFSVFGSQQGVTPGSGVTGAECGLRHNF